MNMLIKS